MKNICPYCNKKDCVPEVAFTHCEMYGGSGYTVKCEKCGKVLTVVLQRYVEVVDIYKSNAKPSETDW